MICEGVSFVSLYVMLVSGNLRLFDILILSRDTDLSILIICCASMSHNDLPSPGDCRSMFIPSAVYVNRYTDICP